MQGEPLLEPSYNHVAFSVVDADHDDRLARIRALGLEVLDGRKRIAWEGRSVYFCDHDNHLFELHSGTMEERLARHAALSKDDRAAQDEGKQTEAA